MDSIENYPTTAVPTEPIITPEAWRGEDLAKTTEWLYKLSEEELRDIDDALRHVEGKGLVPPEFTKEDFPLPIFGSSLDEIREELEGGRGFIIMRGIDRVK